MSSSNQRVILIAGSLVIIAAGAILILSAVTGGSPTAAPAAAVTQSALPSAAPAEIPYPEIVRVRLGNAKAAYDLKQATFLDVRDAESYANSHVPGAISIPLAELEARLKEIDPNAWILTYCT